MIERTLMAGRFRSGHKWGGLFVHSAVAFAISLAVAATPASVSAETFTVNTTDDITGARNEAGDVKNTQSFR
ncbi:MAG: hypothetical protein ACKVK6_15860, partial [bacterium]